MKQTSALIRNTEKMALLAGVFQPLMILPQISTILVNKSANDVSLATWAGTLLLGLPILLYGIVHRLRPIIVTQIINATLQITVVIAIIIYQY
ncbi:hypothetical protein EOL73_00360 [Candidatus Saccharibacteria bacterium]|nr:hypothetical protein [Candidatus Saccharibacteria bacterium]NCU40194.1 hypothetical protein [Candidatus Saccharibacteria bacterium]